MPARARTRDELDLPPAPPAFDAYSGLLVISFIAMLFGLVFLWMDYSQFKDKPPAGKSINVTTATP
jgi:hypothetical protein